MPLRRRSQTETQRKVPREQDLAIVASEPDTCTCKDSEAASGTCIGVLLLLVVVMMF